MSHRYPHSLNTMSQNERWKPNTEWPHWGRDVLDHGHAIFNIAKQLDLLGLRAWTPIIVQWMGSYDGFEMHLLPELDPLNAVLTVLTEFAVNADKRVPASDVQRYQRKTEIASEFIGLPFIAYRAHWYNRPRKICRGWEPLQQTWMRFIESGEEADELWVSPTNHSPRPDLQTLQQFLLAPSKPGSIS